MTDETIKLTQEICKLKEELRREQSGFELISNDMKKNKEAIGRLMEMHRVQGFAVKGYYDDYNQGLYNGLELAIAIITNKEPNYIPPCIIEDRPR